MGVKKGSSALGSMIKEARISKGLSQEDLGSKVGCTGSYITGIEKGRHLSKTLLEGISKTLSLNFSAMTNLNDLEHAQAQILKIKNPELKNKLLEVLGSQCKERTLAIGGHLICESSDQYRFLENAVLAPEKHPIVNDDKEAKILLAFRRIPADRRNLLVMLAETLADQKK